jgi:hypothetical protein
MYPAYPNAAQRQLEEAERSDSGRGLEFVYFSAGGGAQFAAFGDAASGTLLPPDQTSAFGPYVSAAAGLRLLFLTIGPSFRFARFSAWDLWTLNLDLGWHIPLGNLEPYATIGGGFAKLGYPDASYGSSATRTVSTAGFDVRLAGGVDYYVTNVLSVGGTFQAEFLRLSGDYTFSDGGTARSGESSTLGFALSAGAVLGLHF